MKFLFQPLICYTAITAALLFLACAPSKPKEVKLEDWISKKSNGEYVVDERLLELNPTSLIKGKRTAIIAMKQQPDVQVRILWNKNLDDLGLDMDSIHTQMESAASDHQVARSIVSYLKTNATTPMSVGVIRPAIYFLLYGDPTSAARAKALEEIFKCLDHHPHDGYNSVWIEWMESPVNGKEIKDIVPNGYWYREDGVHERNKILSLNFEYSNDMNRGAIAKGWAVNPRADRATDYDSIAYNAGLAWAEKNIKAPFYLESHQYTEYVTVEDDPMVIEYSFPVFDKVPQEDDIDVENKGYVRVLYNTDKKAVLEIQKVNEL